MALLSPKNVRFELRDPDLIKPWDQPSPKAASYGPSKLHYQICCRSFGLFAMSQELGGGVLYLAQFSLPTIEFVVWSFRIVIQDILLDQFFVVP